VNYIQTYRSCLARQSFLLFTELPSQLTAFDTDYMFEYCVPMAMHPTLLRSQIR
jgi:hypothetical protein